MQTPFKETPRIAPLTPCIYRHTGMCRACLFRTIKTKHALTNKKSTHIFTPNKYAHREQLLYSRHPQTHYPPKRATKPLVVTRHRSHLVNCTGLSRTGFRKGSQNGRHTCADGRHIRAGTLSKNLADELRHSAKPRTEARSVGPPNFSLSHLHLTRGDLSPCLLH